jgi:hypothetical protein
VGVEKDLARGGGETARKHDSCILARANKRASDNKSKARVDIRKPINDKGRSNAALSNALSSRTTGNLLRPSNQPPTPKKFEFLMKLTE